MCGWFAPLDLHEYVVQQLLRFRRLSEVSQFPRVVVLDDGSVDRLVSTGRVDQKERLAIVGNGFAMMALSADRARQGGESTDVVHSSRFSQAVQNGECAAHRRHALRTIARLDIEICYRLQAQRLGRRIG